MEQLEKDEKYMRLALALAHEAALAGEVPVGMRSLPVAGTGASRIKTPCAMRSWRPLMRPAVSWGGGGCGSVPCM